MDLELIEKATKSVFEFAKMFGLATKSYMEFHQKVMDAMQALPPERIRTGIQPKRSRTRKKQRLTRLQRRQKRQKCTK